MIDTRVFRQYNTRNKQTVNQKPTTMTSLRWSMTRRRVNNGLYPLKRKTKQKYEPRNTSRIAQRYDSSFFQFPQHTKPDRMRQIRHRLKCIWT